MSKQNQQSDAGGGPNAAYWEDPVYRYLSKLQRDGLADRVPYLDAVMQSLIDGSIVEDRYAELLLEARTTRKQEKADRKSRQKNVPRPKADDEAALNVADLKKRIFNPRVSKANMIKAIEALPPRERKETVDGLPPGLKRKLGKYLTG